MRKKTIFLLVACWFLNFQTTRAQGITLGDYCDFLNDTQECCYEKVVGFNTQIMRLGKPGAYQYVVLEENEPLCGISQSDLLAYEAWKDGEKIEFQETIDPLLKINRSLSFVYVDQEKQQPTEAPSLSTTFAGGLFFLSFLCGESMPHEEEKKVPLTTLTLEEQEAITTHLQKTIEREEDFSVMEQLLKEQGEGWKSHLHICQEEAESHEKLATAEANLKQIKEENSTKARSKNRLGQAAEGGKKGGRYITMGGATLTATGILAPVGVPMVVAGAFIKQGGEALDQVNQTIGEKAVQLAAAQKNRASEKAEKMEGKMKHGEDGFLIREENFQKIKETLLKEELARTHLLAQGMVPQSSWGEHEWQQWGEHCGMNSGLVIKSQENQEWLHWKTAELWQKRVKKSRLVLDTLRRKIKKRLTPLERKSEFLWGSVKQAKEEYEKALAREEELPLEQKKKQQRRDELKSIAARAFQKFSPKEEELLNYFTSEERREYKAILKWLQEFERDFQLSQENRNELRIRWEAKEEVVRRHQPTEQQEYYHFLTQILENRVRADQEALRQHWPEADFSFRPYLKWELLAPEELEQREEELTQEEEIGVPEKLIEELEAKGRRYWHQAQEIIKQALEVIEAPEQTQEKRESVPLLDSIPLSEEPQEALVSWSLDQMNHPTAWDKKRWKARAELEEVLSQARELKSFLASLQGEELTGENKTTLGTEINKRELDKWTESSFGGGRTVSLLETQIPIKITFEELRNACDQIASQVNKKKRAWKKAIQETEKNGELGEQKEEDWKEADQTALRKFLSEYHLTTEKEIAKKLEGSWDRNIKRWRIFKKADELRGEIEQNKNDRNLHDPDSNEYAALSAVVNELEKRYQDERDCWERELGSKATTEEEKKKYEGKDQRVLNRWNRFVERKKGESNTHIEKSQTKNSTLVRAHASEKEALEDAEKDTPGAKEYWEKVAGELLKLFTKEKKRLDRIEKIWESIAKAQEEALWNRCRLVAERYEENSRLWKEELKSHERDYYNKEVIRRNREEPLAKEEEELKELRGILDQAKESLEKRKAYVEGQMAKGATTPGRFLGLRKSYRAEEKELEKKLQELLTSSLQREYDQRLEALQKRKEERQRFRDFGNKSEQERKEYIEREIIRKKREQWLKKTKDCNDRAVATKQKKIAKILSNAARVYEAAAEAESKENTQAVKLYSQCGEAYEKQMEALVRGDGIEAAKQEKIAEVLSNAVKAYEQAAEVELKGNAQLAELYRKCGETYKKQVEALERGDKAEANKQEKIVKVLGGYNEWNPGAAWIYEQAAQAESKGNCQTARLYRKCGEAYEKQAEALERGDKAEVNKQEKIAEALRHVASVYEKASKAESKGNAQAAEFYRKSGEAYEKQVEALERGNETEANKQRKIAKELWSTAQAYEQAAEAESKGNTQAAKLYRKSGEAYEKQVEALVREDEVEAVKQEKIAKILRGYNESDFGAAWAYREAAEAESKGNSQAAKLYRQRGEVYGKQAEALVRGDEAEASRQEKIAEILRGYSVEGSGAVWTYGLAAKAESQENSQAAELYRRSGEAYEKQAEALVRGDEAEASRQEKIAEILGGNYHSLWGSGAAWSYEQAAEAESIGNVELARVYRQCREVYEKQIEALGKGDEIEAVKWKKIAGALGVAAWAYKQAAKAELTGNSQAAKLYRKSGEAYEKQVEALVREDEVEAAKQEKIAKILRGYNESDSGAAWAYEKAAKAGLTGNSQAAEFYRKSGEAYGKQAGAVVRGDEAEATKQEKIAGALGSAAWAYEKAAKAGLTGNSQAAESYRKSGEAYEKQAEALERKDETEATKQEKIAKALEAIAWAYEKAADAESKGNAQLARLCRNLGGTYEKQAEALERGDQTEANKQKKIAEMLENVAWSYKKNKKTAEAESSVKQQGHIIRMGKPMKNKTTHRFK